jgi:hypothetical protein
MVAVSRGWCAPLTRNVPEPAEQQRSSESLVPARRHSGELLPQGRAVSLRFAHHGCPSTVVPTVVPTVTPVPMADARRRVPLSFVRMEYPVAATAIRPTLYATRSVCSAQKERQCTAGTVQRSTTGTIAALLVVPALKPAFVRPSLNLSPMGQSAQKAPRTVLRAGIVRPTKENGFARRAVAAQ